MLTISGLTKRFHGVAVFSGFHLSLPTRGFTALVGPSGCGKSTLFDVLTGVLPADSGDIRWKSQLDTHLGTVAAYMQQRDLLLPWLTLKANALLPVTVTGKASSAADDRARQLFSEMGLTGYESYLPRAVSGGMRQRCALVRTLMFERDLVLLDEPLSALDAITRRSLQSHLLLLQSRFEKSILMITHDVEEALLLADEVVVLGADPMDVRERIVLASPKPRSVDDPELVRMKTRILEKLQKELKP
jgi:NitT/TauT family transport system ATP-binding protein